jgi:hypothetical protein
MYSNQARDAYPNIPPQTETGLVLGIVLDIPPQTVHSQVWLLGTVFIRVRQNLVWGKPCGTKPSHSRKATRFQLHQVWVPVPSLPPQTIWFGSGNGSSLIIPPQTDRWSGLVIGNG